MKPKHRRFLHIANIHLVLALSAMPIFAADYTWDGSTASFDTVHWDAGAGVVAWPGIGNNAIIPNGRVAVGATWDVDAVTLTGGGLEVTGGGLFNRAFGLDVATASANAEVTVAGGAVSRNFINAGSGSGVGTVAVSSGSLASTGEIWLGSNTAAAGFGVMNITGGTVTSGSWLAIGRGVDTGTGDKDTRGVLTMSNGTLNVNGGNLSIGAYRVAGAATSLMSLSGGTVNVTNSVFVGENASGILDMSGGNLTTGVAGVVQVKNTFNMRGGTATTGGVSNRAGGTSIINFNGGTLKAGQNSTTFMQGLTQANIFGSGATIDTNGKNITIGQALLAPTGNGVSATGLSITGGSGYAAAPIVDISGGGGTGATAVATITGGVVTGITITNPGTGYTSVPTFSLVGGGGTGAGIAAGSATTVANSSGGLTKNGTGNLTLSGSSSYTGLTQVNAGGLIVNGDLQSDISVAADADFGGSGQTTSGSLTFAPGSHKFYFNPAGITSFLAGSITATGATITVVPDGVITPVTNKVILESYVPITGGTFVTGNSRLSVSVSGGGDQLLASYTPASIVWKGSDGTNPTFWDTDVTANWDNATVTDKFIAADSVTFNDSATPASPVVVAIQAAVQPSSVTFGNSAKDYVVSGAAITGATGLAVSGGGAVTLSNSNTYTGATLVSNGTLNLSGSIVNAASATVTGGSLNVSGSISGNGLVTANGGKIAVTGSLTGGADLLISNVAGKAILNTSGTITRNRLWFGGASGASGAAYQTAGAVSTTLPAGNSLGLGILQGGYGYYKISGGTLTTEEIAIGTWGTAIGGNNGGSGMLEITGGTVTNNGWLVVNRSEGAAAVGQLAVLNVSGGSLTYAGAGLQCNWGSSGNTQTTVINVSGSGSISTTVAGNQPINLSRSGNAATTGILNLNGGTVTPAYITGNRGFVNFNGGTLRPNSDNANFLAVNTAQIYAGGATIDTNGKNITIGQNLLAPTGNGVTTIAVADGGSGYVSAPILTISGGTGSGATAVANMIDDGTGNGTFKIGSITVTGAGNYTAAPTTITQTGGGAGTAATFGAIATATNTSGGLTKNGTGTLTLTGANTFTGAVVINGGTLYANAGNAANNRNFSYASDITVNNGATLRSSANALFGWGGTQDKAITVNAGGMLTADSGADVGVGTVTLAGGELGNLGASAVWGSWRFDNPADVLRATENSTVSAVNVKFQNGGSIDVAAGKTLSFTGTITDSSSGGVSSVVKTGTGTLTLSGTNSYTGATAVNGGTLALGASGSIGSTSVSIAAGATLDTTAQASYTAPASLTLGVDSSGTSGKINAAGKTLVISGTAVTFNVSGVLTAPAYVLATYGTISGTPTFLSATPPTGYTINYTYNGGTQIALVQNSDPFQSWIDTPAFGLTAGQKGKSMDPDNDGQTNVTEFALDGSPNSGASTGKVVSKIASVGGSPTLVLTLPVRAGATFSVPGSPTNNELVSGTVDGVIYKIQGGSDLSIWTDAVSEVTGTDKATIETGLPALGGAGWTYRTFRSPVAVSGNPKKFLRAVIVAP